MNTLLSWPPRSALGATATARALARIYMALADGEELVSRPSVERFCSEQVWWSRAP